MISAILSPGSAAPPSILCLGAHCDDVEIGCGGMLLTTIERYPQCRIDWVIFCAEGDRAAEAETAAKRIFGENQNARLHLLSFTDGFLPYEGMAAKRALQDLASNVSPDLILTHHQHDAHQDHRLVGEITFNVFRDHLILEYEIPKYDGDLGQPRVYVPLSATVAENKIDIILDSYASQAHKHWFNADTFRSLMHLRGLESGRQHRFAEAFYCRKLVVGGF